MGCCKDIWSLQNNYWSNQIVAFLFIADWTLVFVFFAIFLNFFIFMVSDFQLLL